MTPKDIFKTIKDKDVKYVDLRFTDTRGKEQHVSVPVTAFGEDKFTAGHFFDGSSVAGSTSEEKWSTKSVGRVLMMASMAGSLPTTRSPSCSKVP